MGTFAAQVEARVKEIQGGMLAVAKQSTQKVVELAQSRIPVDTGFARASIRGALDGIPAGTMRKGDPMTDGSGQVSAVIASAQLGDVISVGWTANYAIYLEYGHSSQAPSGFVGISAMEWPRIVEETQSELLERIGR